MTKETEQLIEKGRRGLKAARKHFEEGDYDFCVSRAYYAMFHVTEALLLTQGIASSSHGGLLSLFFEHFIKTGLIDKNHHQDLHRAFGLRQQGDYWSDAMITEEMAKGLLVKAEGYFATLRRLIK